MNSVNVTEPVLLPPFLILQFIMPLSMETQNMQSDYKRDYQHIDFQNDVLAAELEEIHQRVLLDKQGNVVHRADFELPDFDRFLPPKEARSDDLNSILSALTDEENQRAWNDDPTVQHRGLIGLAFSGGGIRSATTNLGVLQALRKTGILQCVDYLSTVSGGGYVGACFTAASTSITEATIGRSESQRLQAQNALFRHTPGVPESPVFRHLRNNSNYMAPDGIVDILRVPSIFLRGMTINFFLLLPYILMAAVVTASLISSETHPFAFLARIFAGVSIPLNAPYFLTKCLLIFSLAVYLASPTIWHISQRIIANQKAEDTGWQWRDRASHFLGWLAIADIVSAFAELQPVAVQLYAHYVLSGWSFEQMTLAGGLGNAIVSMFVTKWLPKLSALFSRLGIYSVGLIGALVFWLLYLHLTNMLLSALATQNGAFAWKSSLGFCVMAGLLWLCSLFIGNTNFTSISRFYRDRLSKAYMVGIQPDGSVRQIDTLKLSALDSMFTPYQLINATLNLSATKEGYRSDRRSDFFLLSKRYIGSMTTGYSKTEEMECYHPDLDVATAVAISAAAAAPNAGRGTVKALTFILAMLNIRYDYWIANPRHLRKTNAGLTARGFAALLPTHRVGPLYFMRELLGNLSADSPYINLSDGGHLENIGLYELIRRECRLVIVGDSEEDHPLHFTGLSEVIRMVQIDFGVQIVMDGLDAIRKGMQHHAVGTIYYRNGKVGKILYLKNSLLGDATLHDTLGDALYASSKGRTDSLRFDDNPYIARYKTAEPLFPHQSSSNQFYNETQFECYRALGYQIATTGLMRSGVKEIATTTELVRGVKEPIAA